MAAIRTTTEPAPRQDLLGFATLNSAYGGRPWPRSTTPD